MIKTFNTTILDGPMSERKKYYDNNLSRLEIEKDLLRRRIELGKRIGFDGTKILTATPYSDYYKYGKTIDVTDDVKGILETNPNYDLWDLDYMCDIMLVRSSLKGIVLAAPVADCPVVIASTKDIMGIVNCTSSDIDKELPIKLIDAIEKSVETKTSDIDVYIGPCAGTSYNYINHPRWARNKVWNTTIEKSDEGYSINLRKTIMLELLKRGIQRITVSPVDTITNPEYYSHYATVNEIESKPGRILVGAYFEQPKVKTK